MKLQDLLDKDEILDTLGLMTKPSAGARWLGGLGIFSLGLVAGAAAALLLAPSSGQELRRDLNTRLQRAKESKLNGSMEQELGV